MYENKLLSHCFYAIVGTGDAYMIKRIFSIITFILSISFFIALLFSLFTLLDFVERYLGTTITSVATCLFSWVYEVQACVVAIPGVITSAISFAMSENQSLKTISGVFLAIFIVVFIFSATTNSPFLPYFFRN